jgi:hypothetical protein
VPDDVGSDDPSRRAKGLAAQEPIRGFQPNDGTHARDKVMYREGTSPVGRVWMGLERWGTRGKPMEEIAAAQPWQGNPRTAEAEVGADQEAQGHEQRHHGVAQGTRMVPICARINDLERMQGRMTGLDKQHREAEEHENSIGPSANAGREPPQSQPSIRLTT